MASRIMLCSAFRLINSTRIITGGCNKLRLNNEQKLFQSGAWEKIPFISARTLTDIEGIEDPVKVKKKKVIVPQVTLLNETDELSVVSLEEANKIAKRRNVKLVKIVDVDVKSQRPVYKLMSVKDFIESEAKSKAAAKIAKEQSLKDDKTITLSSKIFEHDLDVKVKSIMKMFRKKHGVRVVISIDGKKSKSEDVRNYIITKTQDIAKVITKSDSGSTLKVTLRPMLDKIKAEAVTNEELIDEELLDESQVIDEEKK